jgi:2-polyprenyl-6-methoxyphenol hydroxylase-like FAD-dependent oxidoreductase
LATEALARAAAEAGARVFRGVSDVTVSPGERPEASFTTDGQRQDIEADLIVGADGRNSIVRRASGKALNRHKANHYVAGLLVEGLPDEAMQFDTLAIDEGRFVLAFPQGEGRARVYVCPDSSAKARYAGELATEHLLEDADIPCMPFGEAIAASTPIGPCKSYPGHDTWLDEPAAVGVVLIGDSAGYQSPIIATGLSSALRDTRMVVEALTNGTDGGDFREYSTERAERGRRLRFVSALYETLSTGTGAARRYHTASRRMEENPELGRWRAAQLFGPELPPAEAFAGVVYEQLTAPD